MATEQEIATARRAYAEELRAAAPVLHQEPVVEAFAVVPRERFLGPGPWTILPGQHPADRYVTPDADPRRLYHDVLVPLDDSAGINNGQPSLWAFMFDRLALRPGERILQVGAGTGYYSAILGELVGSTGRVTAVEYDPALAARAAALLEPWPQVELIQGDAATVDPGTVDAVVAFAGITHPIPLWLDRLAQGGRLMVGLTGPSMWGFMLLATRAGAAFHAAALGSVGIIPFVGRDEAAAQRLARALRDLGGETPPIASLHRGTPAPDDPDLWHHGPGFWLSRRPLAI